VLHEENMHGSCCSKKFKNQEDGSNLLVRLQKYGRYSSLVVIVIYKTASN
jgi:hypothetical protein